MKSIPNLDKNLVGVGGEYCVAAELAMRGYEVVITPRNKRGRLVDIDASNCDGSKSVSIQVTTTNSTKAKWPLNKKDEDFFSENHFYVFVALHELGTRPDFYVVHSEVVAKSIRRSHSEWLTGKKADGTPRKDSARRNFSDIDGDYKEGWDLLDL